MARGRGKLTPQELEYMKIISDNIKKLLEVENYKQADLSRGTGIPASTLTGYVKGTSLPIAGNVQKIADFFHVKKSDIDPRFTSVTPPNKDSPPLPSEKVITLDRDLASVEDGKHGDWISYGEELLKSREITVEESSESYETEAPATYHTDTEQERYEYHVYEKAAAGNGYGYIEDARNYDTVFHDEDIPHDFATWIWGDSMEPKYLNGEVALIKATGFDYDGAIYVIDWDGQSYIKKVYKEKDGLRLVSLNKKYSDKFAPYSEDPRIIGKVIGSFKVER